MRKRKERFSRGADKGIRTCTEERKGRRMTKNKSKKRVRRTQAKIKEEELINRREGKGGENSSRKGV